MTSPLQSYGQRALARARSFAPLRRKVRVPVWGDLGLRLAAALFLVSIVVFVHWLDREGLQDSHDGHISFLDVVYFTMISITTTGFGDIAPISNQSRLVEALIVTRSASPCSSSSSARPITSSSSTAGRSGAWRASRKRSPIT